MAETPKLGICRLCKANETLVKSHLIPKGFYKKITPTNQGATILTREKTFTSSRQMQDELLCLECENRFSIRENYVLSITPQLDGKFPLRDWLKHAKLITEVHGGLALEGDSVSALNVEQLAYFAASVFWRGSAHYWQCYGRKVNSGKLGEKYDEQFRRFLLGQLSFPNDARLIVIAGNSDKPTMALSHPVRGRREGYYIHRFSVPGIQFLLQIGQRVPKDSENCCIVHSPKHTIFLGSWDQEFMLSDMRMLAITSEQSMKLKQEMRCLAPVRDE